MAKQGGGTRTRLVSSLAVLPLLSATPLGATVAVRPADTLPAAVAPQPAAPAETPFVQTEHLTRPVSLAAGVTALDALPTEPDWRAAWTVQGLSFGEMLRAAAAAPSLVPIAITGVVLIVIASLARRRRRRRLGWGLLPDRQQANRQRD